MRKKKVPKNSGHETNQIKKIKQIKQMNQIGQINQTVHLGNKPKNLKLPKVPREFTWGYSRFL